jgi:hypothetical protein
MKYRLITTSILLLLIGSSVQAIEIINDKGSLDAKVFDGKIYNDRGRYTGMITPEKKMYNEKGEFTGQIKNNSIIDMNGNVKGFIRDGKIYDKEGAYTGQLK